MTNTVQSATNPEPVAIAGQVTRPGSASAAPADPGFGKLQELARSRVAIEGVNIEIDGGRFPSRAVAGHPLVVEADIFCDGHEGILAAIRYAKSGSAKAEEAPMLPGVNDRWMGTITLPENAFYDVTILSWRDLFGTWAKDIVKKFDAGQNITLELTEGRQLVETALAPENVASSEDKAFLAALLAQADLAISTHDQLAAFTAPAVVAAMLRAQPRTNLTEYKTLKVFADREAAAFSAWYELMPRSQSGSTKRHGTFDDVIARLPYVRDLGFNVLYFPPIHPIGKTNRKGRNNTLTPAPDDPGSPYAIGAPEGGHDAIHPELGDFESFKRLVDTAKDYGLEIALDFAIQCSPDHPWIKQHPEWFDWRPDGTIKFAENPPKKYEDIVNVHFYRGALPDLWYALRDIVLFWIDQGIKIFRVDNPHTKPFPFWEWMIGEVRALHPDTIFLAEAFTRPKVMKRLAKVGFNQSYSYFTWRNDRQGLTEYLTELTQEECREYMRPNFFVNTPDINPTYLQNSGRPGFRTRLCLAASLGGNYGVYNGYEICEAAPMPGKEEYLDSEKYEIRAWDMDKPGHIKDDIRLMNALRQRHPALRDFLNVTFYNTTSEQVLSYSKKTPDLSNFLLFHVNLDPHNTQVFQFEVPLWEFGLPDDASILVRDAIHGNTFTWHGKPQWLDLEPHTRPYTIWQLFAPGTSPE
ncbi:alpha-1,4-glucan--maltose-1-phosphate maltosyltransferase [Amaricoccus macauensis]|uniref:alpha-1,4-glucan--maltose-1-phosphate maltosyltransferase n=1 Tax=Amaricoccus macauensis TaxID=57001 RepID=UPI003C7E75E6